MPIRMTGINSGMDTESIIKDLVKVKSAKKEKLIKEQTKMEWKQEAWKELNAKVYGLYTKTLSNLRFKSDFMKKATKLSDSSVASVVTSGSAVDGVQQMQVSSLAKSGYLTGGVIEATGSSKLTDLGVTTTTDGKIKFDLYTGPSAEIDNQTPKTIELDAGATINDFVKALKAEGLNANFDSTNGRFFISSAKSGEDANFELRDFGNKNSTSSLAGLGLDYKATVVAGQETEKTAYKIDGVDAQITLNGAIFKSSTNTFDINGLTITVNKETAGNEVVTLTTAQDTDGIYDMVKNFLKEYNAIINEMDKLYNADSAKGYEPLTDEERDALSEKEIEKWEGKIKDAILRKDDTLNTVASAMKSIMSSGVDVGGKKMYLSDFGINTLGYFNAPDNEKNAYHIDGDSDNINTMNNEDKLRAAIAKDPDSVVSFFTGLADALYNKIGDMMKRTDYSSSFTLYDDILMKKDYDDYKQRIAREEEKITAFEDRYYKKFGAMETALASLQSKESAIAGLFNM